MADEAIIEAEYVEWKMVKTRKALQLIFEVPLEFQAKVQNALGTPLPDVSTPVAIVRMMSEAELVRGIEALAPPPITADEPLPRKAKSLAQIAGILCATGSFQKFVGAKSEAEAADYIRGHCNVVSRADIDGNEEAERIFWDIKGEYDMWMAHPDAFAPRETRAA